MKKIFFAILFVSINTLTIAQSASVIGEDASSCVKIQEEITRVNQQMESMERRKMFLLSKEKPDVNALKNVSERQQGLLLKKEKLNLIQSKNCNSSTIKSNKNTVSPSVITVVNSSAKKTETNDLRSIPKQGVTTEYNVEYREHVPVVKISTAAPQKTVAYYDSYIKAIETKIAYVKTTEDENTKAVESGWFDEMNKNINEAKKARILLLSRKQD